MPVKGAQTGLIPIHEIKKEMIQVIRNLYPKGYRFYGAEITEGYEKPSFFTQILPVTMETETKNIRNNVMMLVITYFQRETNEADFLKKAHEIRAAFGLKVKVGDRHFNVTDFDYDFIGNDDDILQIRVTVSFKERIERIEEHPITGRMGFRLEVSAYGNARN